MSRLITSHDIAKAAGVSRTTVSYVLSNRPGVSVSGKTRRRVLATARRLGYVPNSAAAMLVTGRSKSIGLVLSRPELISVDGFIPIMVHGLNEVCSARGYRLLMEAVPDPPGVDDYLRLAKSKRVDSMIVLNPRKGDPALRKVIETTFPVLVAGSAEQSRESAIGTQDRQGSRKATEHLLSLGHKRVAHISYASLNYHGALLRLEGYRLALEAAKIPYDKSLFAEGDFTAQSGYDAMKRILASHSRPTALFAGNDTIATGAMLALREADLSVPDNFAVVGYDDLPIASYTCPPLTTIRTHPFEQGKLLAEAAIALMNSEKVGSQQDALPLELVIRNSCGVRNSGPGSSQKSLRKRGQPSKLSNPRKERAAKRNGVGRGTLA
jgi:DNA-binding LacI/PurR family transcriptional regulator